MGILKSKKNNKRISLQIIHKGSECIVNACLYPTGNLMYFIDCFCISLLHNILYGNCGWLNALFSKQRNCPLQFVAWKGYWKKKKEKKKEGREDQLWWLENEGGEREFQQHLR